MARAPKRRLRAGIVTTLLAARARRVWSGLTAHAALTWAIGPTRGALARRGWPLQTITPARGALARPAPTEGLDLRWVGREQPTSLPSRRRSGPLARRWARPEQPAPPPPRRRSEPLHKPVLLSGSHANRLAKGEARPQALPPRFLLQRTARSRAPRASHSPEHTPRSMASPSGPSTLSVPASPRRWASLPSARLAG